MTTGPDAAGGDERAYVLGTHDEELRRLGFQHAVWRGPTAALWERAGFRPGQRLIDLGCGPGFTTMDLAALVGPSGRVTACDASPRYIEHLTAEARARGLSMIEARCVDVQAPDLPARAFDGAFARWVLCFVAEPQRAIEAAAKALRPGGILALQEYFDYGSLSTAPPSAALARVVSATMESWKARGGDADIARRLPELLRRSGFAVRDMTPVVRLGRPGSAVWQWVMGFLRGFAPKLVEMGLLSAEECAAFERDANELEKNPDAYLVTPAVLELLAVRSA
jgi:SAM-dependent methyltransferase